MLCLIVHSIPFNYCKNLISIISLIFINENSEFQFNCSITQLSSKAGIQTCVPLTSKHILFQSHHAMPVLLSEISRISWIKEESLCCKETLNLLNRVSDEHTHLNAFTSCFKAVLSKETENKQLDLIHL